MSNAEIISTMSQWGDNFECFISEALQAGIVLSSQQKLALAEINKLIYAKTKSHYKLPMTDEELEYSKKIGVSIMSGKGLGKDALAAMVILAFMSCYPEHKVCCVAPTSHQLKDVLWSEISKWLKGPAIDKDPPIIRDWFTLQSDKLFLTELGGKDYFCIARTANPKAGQQEQAETLSGLHAPNVMIIFDEAAIIQPAVFATLEGTLTGKCNFLLMIFNPTRSKGYAIDSQFKDRSMWIPLRWNAEESELVKPESIELIAKKYGKDSNKYRTDVLGLPPRSDVNSLIPVDWIMDAIERDVFSLDEDQEVIGIDVGAGGDTSVLLRRVGPRVVSIETCDFTKSEELTGWLLRRIFDYDPRFIMIDSIGVGWGIAGNLRSRVKMEIIEVNVAELGAYDDRYFRLRDELWFSLRERLEKGEISIPDDPDLISELSELRYKEMEHNGKLKVESKAELRKRGFMSPNKGDALMMTEYIPQEMVRKMGKSRRKDWRAERPGTWRTV